ncbi:MAG: lysylphosphatidylglycerol synthase transmembrane domain-containing protein [Candidatus Eisenbacteria bacterium]
MTGSRRIVTIARCGIGIGILAYLLATLRPGNVVRVFAAADPASLAVGFVLLLTIRSLGAWQLAVAIRHLDFPLTIIRAFLINAISTFYGLVLPGGEAGGAVVKWYALTRQGGKRAEAFATMLLLRIVNTAVIILVGITALLVENPLRLENTFVVPAALVAGLAAALLLFRDSTARRLELSIGRAPRWVPERFRRGILGVFVSLGNFKSLSARQTTIILAVPLVSQAASVLLFIAVTHSLGLNIPLVAQLWIISMVYLIQTVPAGVFGLGLREGALVLLLPRYGADPAEALAFSLILYGYNFLYGLTGGIAEATRVIFTPSKESVNRGRAPDLGAPEASREP